MSEKKTEWVFWALASVVLVGWLGFHFYPWLACAGECYADFGTIHGYPVAYLELDDTRLNTWILAWTQHALLTPGTALFDANAFYPARSSLAGSEHLLGQALFTLPLRLFADNAISIYGWALIASYAILGLSTLAFVRWLTGSRLISLLAAVAAMAMPWREAELSHIQLLWACWFPLIVYLTLRIFFGEGTRRHSLLLVIALTLQLLSSYYLAYMITFTLAAISAVAVICVGLDRRVFLKLLPAAIVPYTALALVSFPYLSRAARGEISVTIDPERPLPGNHLANATALLMPRFNSLWNQSPGFEIKFFIPATILLLAALSLGWFFRRAQGGNQFEEARESRARIVVLALGSACLLAFVMTLGSHLEIGTSTFRLPGYWSALLLPGFSNLRAPHRWAIVICTLVPVIATLGALWLDEARRRWHPSVGRVFSVLAIAAVLINIPWTQVPATPASKNDSDMSHLYSELASLPFAPVLELPWHLDSISRNSADTRYMVDSTRHWRPILNGFTALLPPSFHLLNRIAHELPSPSALARLSDLTDLRWIIVHWEKLPRQQHAAWTSELPENLRLVFRNSAGAIFELQQDSQSGRWMRALAGENSNNRTLSGLSRQAIVFSEGHGGILSLETGPPFRFMGLQPLMRSIRVLIDNPDDHTWPSLDVDPEGLVMLRYAFSDLEDHLIETNNVPLDQDLPPGKTAVSPIISAPAHSGRYRLCADLVQIVGRQPQPLPFDPVELEVEVAGFAEERGDALERLAIAIREYRHEDPEESFSRCARQRRAGS